MNGHKVCQTLKSNPETADINIIFMSGNFSNGEKQKGLDLGTVEYFGKPPVLKLTRVHRETQRFQVNIHLFQ